MKRNKKTISLAVTGGIGSGKSTACTFLREIGLPVISADDLAHEVLQMPDIINQLVNHFGEEILTDGKIDRLKLGQIAFTKEDGKSFLNQIMHPRIIQQLLLELNTRKELTVYEIPLLFEAELESLFDLVLLINTPEDTRLERISSRPGMTTQKAQSIFQSQLPDSEKAARADVIINNTGNLEDLKKKLTELVSFILKDTGEFEYEKN